MRQIPLWWDDGYHVRIEDDLDVGFRNIRSRAKISM